MDSKSLHSIPIGLLGVGEHEFHFALDAAFFAAHEVDVLPRGAVEIALLVDKQDRLSTMKFHLSGWIDCDCDRCLQTLTLPLDIEHLIYIRAMMSSRHDDRDDVIYIVDGQQDLELDEVMRDLYLLSIPMRRVCSGDETVNCDQRVQTALGTGMNPSDDDTGQDVWSKLKQALDDKL